MVGLAGAAWAGGAARPELRVESQGGESVIYAAVESSGGVTPWTRLGAYEGAVEAGASGSDPAGRAYFVTWRLEDGRELFSYSRDGGEHWSAPMAGGGAPRLRGGEIGEFGALPPAPPEWRQGSGGGLFIVALRTASLPEWRQALRDAGARIIAAVPKAGHLIEAGDFATERIREMDFVARLAPFHPWYRLSPELQEWLRESPPEATIELRLVSTGWGAEEKSRLAQRVQALGGRILSLPENGPIVEAELDRVQLEIIARDDGLQWIDRRTPSQTDMDLVSEDSGRVWLEGDSGDCGQGVRGEVFDAGFEETHQDFDGVMLHGPHDLMNHGSSTYGIVFGNGDRDGDGDPKAEGMLPCAEQGIFADKDEYSDRFAHTQELLAYPYFASFQTNSWGHTRTTAYTSYSQEMDDIVWRLDLAITQSQSNSGTQSSRPEAWAKNVISVGAIKHGNSLETSDDFWGGGASIGPAEDGRIKPDLCYWGDHIYTTTTGGYRPDFNGTSAATPAVAGVLGLELQMWSENVWGTNPQGESVFERRPHAATSKALLINSALQYPFSGTDDDLTRTHQGWGRPNARQAKERAAHSLVVDEGGPLQLGEIARYDVEVLEGESELKVTMVYTDPPGTLSAAMHRINDLDLEVTAPSGDLYHGNYGLDQGEESLPGGTKDDLNTVENVFITYPEPGEWQITVKAAEINQDEDLDTSADDALFALVVTGGAGSAVCDPGEAATALDAQPVADNRVDLSWSAAADAVEYLVYRSKDGCDGGFKQIAKTAATSYTDEPVSGGISQYYVVKAKNSCGGISPASNCAVVTATGSCLEPPLFDGLTQAKDLQQSTCTLELTWNAAAPQCGSDVRYNVYRSADPQFLPGPDSLVASCVQGTSWSDTAVGDGETVSYIVRAEDPAESGSGSCSGGLEEENFVRRQAAPSGPDDILYSDPFESDLGWTLEGEWEIGVPQGLGGSLLGGPDPSVAFEGSQVLGLDLSGQGSHAGNYEPQISQWATSPTFDATGRTQVELRFWRWLGVEESGEDQAILEAYDGASWTEVWSNPPITLSDSNWALETFDLTPILAGAADARLRFGVVSSFNRHFCGWNVDSLEVFEPTTCSPAAAPPPIPDGRFVSGQEMTATRSVQPGEVDVQWDVQSCPCDGHDLLWGSSDDLPAYGYSGAACNLDPGGSDTVGIDDPVPGKFTWWIIVGVETTTEGSHGYRSDGTTRSASGVGFCGIELQDLAGTCP